MSEIKQPTTLTTLGEGFLEERRFSQLINHAEQNKRELHGAEEVLTNILGRVRGELTNDLESKNGLRDSSENSFGQAEIALSDTTNCLNRIHELLQEMETLF